MFAIKDIEFNSYIKEINLFDSYVEFTKDIEHAELYRKEPKELLDKKYIDSNAIFAVILEKKYSLLKKQNRKLKIVRIKFIEVEK
jgi:hypothetical protein